MVLNPKGTRHQQPSGGKAMYDSMQKGAVGMLSYMGLRAIWLSQ